MPATGAEIVVLKKNADRHATTMPAEGTDALYKRCGFKNPDGFEARCVWALPSDDTTVYVKVYGKLEGRAGSENKTELPPPIASTLFFGNIAVAAFIGATPDTAKPTPLSVARLAALLDILMGGSEDLGGEAADRADAALDAGEDDDEDGNDPTALLPRTAAGYAKDGFVVEDEEADSTASESEETEYDESDADDDDDDTEAEADSVVAPDGGAGGAETVEVEPTDNELHAERYDSE